MAKLTLTSISNVLTSATTLNNNSDAIEAAIENTLSRDGSLPNEMNADLDMNSNRIYNLGEPQDDNDAVRKQDIDDLLSQLPSVFYPPDKATQVDAEAGTDNTKWMTPLRVQQAIDENLDGFSPDGEVLLANTTVYIRTDGNDSNTGLANTSGAAWLTIGRAVAYANALNFNNFNLTISVGAGTYNENVAFSKAFRGGEVIFTTTVLSLGNVTINSNDTCVKVENGAIVRMTGTFDLQGTNFHTHCTRFGQLYIQDCTFGSLASSIGYHIYSTRFGYTEITGNYYISGGGGGHMQASHHGHIRVATGTATLIANAAFTSYVHYSLTESDITWTGGATVSYGVYSCTGQKVYCDASTMQWAAGSIDNPLGDSLGEEVNGGRFITGAITEVVIGNSTYGLSSASGSTFVGTCSGTVPHEIELEANVDGALGFSHGRATLSNISGLSQHCVGFVPGTGYFNNASACLLYYVDAVNYVSFSLSSRTSGSFTLTATKVGSPTGTLNIRYVVRKG